MAATRSSVVIGADVCRFLSREAPMNALILIALSQGLVADCREAACHYQAEETWPVDDPTDELCTSTASGDVSMLDALAERVRPGVLPDVGTPSVNQILASADSTSGTASERAGRSRDAESEERVLAKK
jgi:hypothetical protein